MKLFYALDFSDREKRRIAGIRDQAAAWSRSGRFVSEEKLHMTLVFLGETDSGLLLPLLELLDGLVPTPFFLECGFLGSYPRRGGGILWLGVRPDARLIAMQAELNARLRPLGLGGTDASFSPHITLGRKVKLPQGEPSPSIPTLRLRVSQETLCLMESKMVDGKSLYERCRPPSQWF
ncbi:RNA 2',3'-cyclic phosphodiesterase [Anaerotalea alkaliphila]|uniref:RNA 2',3'-cyclic phosphodiesterase n=1 Tax=Anaerotalea alkaliphila TaxID=2662126 RepID=A0A7X5KNS5_9FIRM|nr:RNA 2',3'-cyclic phosphodiesterase [Anaerotalea alkaliphila]NDL68309.1 RNA 2',3'-cyclic phosphodiesterase [Anaerotalea alkaliphila]